MYSKPVLARYGSITQVVRRKSWKRLDMMMIGTKWLTIGG